MISPPSSLIKALLFTSIIHTSQAVRGNSYNGLALTPQMGWDTFNAYDMSYDETTIRTNARLLVDLGFRDLGYKVVIFDDAMTEMERSPEGKLVENHSKFPGGLKNLADELHVLGLQFGVYSSAGKYTCAGYPGSLDRETEDAEWWTSLGADYLKYDNCYNEGRTGTPKVSFDRYAVMSEALNKTGRPFVYSLCNWGEDSPWDWGSTISNSARMSGDITDSFDTPADTCPCSQDEYYCKLPGNSCSMMNILGKAAPIVTKVRQGFWNDLDMLEVGNGNMDYDEYKIHFSMWAALRSPLILGNKLDQLTPEDYAILINPAVLAISQDPSGRSIQRRYRYPVPDIDKYGYGEVQIWHGTLSNGDQVVAYVNAGNSSRHMSETLVDLFGGKRTNPAATSQDWDVYDVWGEDTVMPRDMAQSILERKQEISDAPSFYYNATEKSWAEGLRLNDVRLFGTFVQTLRPGEVLSANVPRHGIAMFRLRPAKLHGIDRNEL